MSPWKVLSVIVCACCWPAFASAASVTIGGASDANIAADVKDATIFQDPVGNSNGAGPGMFAGTNGSNSPRRGLIEFNVAGNVPAGATINSVQMLLFLGQTAGGSGGSFNISLYSLSAPWGEGTTGSTSTMIGGTGQGFAANPGDATWGYSSYNTVPWTSGGAFAASASATTSVGATLNASSTWSTAAMATDVQGWLDNPSTNYGWAVLNGVEGTSNSFRAFWTKEASTASLRPELIVNYTAAPEPAALTLAFAGVVVLVACQRRMQFSRRTTRRNAGA